MWNQGRPRYWIGSYDRWHLVLPVAFVAVLFLMGWLPAPPVVIPPRPVAPRILAETRIDSPLTGSRFQGNRIGDVTGRAEPGSTVVLFYATARQPWRELGRKVVGADGWYGFQVSGFAPGQYTLKASAWAPDGRSRESAAVEVGVVAEPAPVVPRARANRQGAGAQRLRADPKK
jgi:hypothetical protein